MSLFCHQSPKHFGNPKRPTYPFAFIFHVDGASLPQNVGCFFLILLTIIRNTTQLYGPTKFAVCAILTHAAGFLIWGIMESAGIEAPWRIRSVSKFVLCAISGALTGCFAIAGALTGAIAGALAAKATKSGFLRGVSLGAIAGAILSVEVLEASRAYWCMEQTGSRGASSMADFIEELVRGRLVEESLTPPILTAYNLQVGVANTGYDEIHDVHGVVPSRGLSGDSLKKLPRHMISKHMKAENTTCTICLQDIEEGEMARSLPRCQHTFHLTCVDKWLVKNDSCPVCRQNV